ncbi:MAG: hypothetical protein ACI9U5_001320 [Colwellia sp.]|jgi:hypothetical protein
MNDFIHKTSILLCCLSTLLTNKVIAQNELFNALPVSPLAAIEPDTWRLDISNNYSASGSAWSIDFAESEVFQAKLSHQQNKLDCKGNSNLHMVAEQSWQLRIGKGGQIYSLRGDSFGEAMPPQFRSHPKGSFDTQYAPWVDEVLQIVSINTDLNHADSKYFMHGAGVYLTDPLLTKPFYNPILASGVGQQDNSYVSINWAQQAHIETKWRSHAIYYNQYRDVGRGVIEVTSMVYNFAEQKLNRFNFPWGGARHSSFGHYLFSNANDDSVSKVNTDATTPAWADRQSRTFSDTKGWMAFAQDDKDESLTMAIVFGFDQSPRPDFQSGKSSFRYGYAGGVAKPSVTEWRNYQVGAGIRKFDVEPGQGVWVRWYLALGKLSDVKNVIAENNLAKMADYGMLNFSVDNADLIAWSYNGTELIRQATPTGATTFYTFAQPVNNSLPLFYMTDKTGVKFISTNPYQLARTHTNTAGDILYKAYDGETSDWQLMGYVLAASTTDGTEVNSKSYKGLATLLPDSIYLQSEAAIAVNVLTD